MALERKILRGGLITVRRDNYSIIHTRLVENNKKTWCLGKKRGFMGYYNSFYCRVECTAGSVEKENDDHRQPSVVG